MPKRDLIVIGGSAGSVEAVCCLVAELPEDLPAAIVVVIHLSPRSRSVLPDVLMRAGDLLACHPQDGELLQAGQIYVAPPDHHILIGQDSLHLSQGPKEGLHRPSINVTFRSAASAFGPRVIGILLSGMLDDGAAGLWEIGQHGGLTIVQDPAEAQFPSMPLQAIQDSNVRYRLTAQEIGRALPRFLEELVGGNMREAQRNGTAPKYTGFSCPECHGPLYDSGSAGPLTFRCRVGHVLSLQQLVSEHTSAQERKLYEAILALEEGADLAFFTASRMGTEAGTAVRAEGEQLLRHAAEIRKLLNERRAPAVEQL